MANNLKRIYGPAALASGDTTIFTVPLHYRYTVRHVRVANPGSSVVTFKMGVAGTADANLIVQPIDIPAKSTYVESMHVTLAETEVLKANASATGLTITVNIIEQH